MKKELEFIDWPTEVLVNPVKIASEKDEIVMKNATTVTLNDGGGAFHDKKDKNKKENWGGPHARKLPKKVGANRAQQKAKSKAKRKK